MAPKPPSSPAEIKILACADLHIGMRFADYGAAQESLRAARPAALESVVREANAHGCALLVVAGDMFDRLTVSSREVRQAAEILDRFEGETAVLPGNHDFLPAGGCELWDAFRRAAGARTILLDSRRVYDLDIGSLPVRLYPGPCDSKHSRENAVSWVAAARQAEPPEGPAALRVGVAHGSLEGLSPDRQGAYFPMTPAELTAAGLDFWVVGHTHKPDPPADGGERDVLVPGTPEPDGFDCRHGGTAWLLRARAGEPPRRQLLATGACRFLDEDLQLAAPVEPGRLLAPYQGLDAARTLLRLRLRGRLSREDREGLRRGLSALEGRLLWFQADETQLLEEIGEQTIEEQFSRGSFPHRLLRRLLDQGDAEALQEAFELVQESRR